MRILYFTFGPTLQYNRSTNSYRDVAAKKYSYIVPSSIASS